MCLVYMLMLYRVFTIMHLVEYEISCRPLKSTDFDKSFSLLLKFESSAKMDCRINCWHAISEHVVQFDFNNCHISLIDVVPSNYKFVVIQRCKKACRYRPLFSSISISPNQSCQPFRFFFIKSSFYNFINLFSCFVFFLQVLHVNQILITTSIENFNRDLWKSKNLQKVNQKKVKGVNILKRNEMPIIPPPPPPKKKKKKKPYSL